MRPLLFLTLVLSRAALIDSHDIHRHHWDHHHHHEYERELTASGDDHCDGDDTGFFVAFDIGAKKEKDRDHFCSSPHPSSKEQETDVAMMRLFQEQQTQSGRMRRAAVCNGCIAIDTYFHVITDDLQTIGKIPDSTIQSQIALLNREYAGSPFQFNLVDITRTNRSDFFYLDTAFDNFIPTMQSTLGDELREGTRKTLNIYSLKLRNKGLGVATFPASYGGNKDGVFIDYCVVPGGACPPYNNGGILVHEVGHWLGLLHTFEGGCDEVHGDYVSDTPAMKRAVYSCSPNPEPSCQGSDPDPLDNYMGYSISCWDTFTPGQIVRMHDQWFVYRVGTGVCDTDEAVLSMEIRLDKTPEQNYWRLYHANGQKYGQSDFGATEEKSIQVNQICVPYSSPMYFGLADEMKNGLTHKDSYYRVFIDGKLIKDDRTFGKWAGAAFTVQKESGCPDGQGMVIVELLLDANPHETSWKIVNSEGTEVYAEAPYELRGDYDYFEHASVRREICLPYSAYTFTIDDAFGDGFGRATEDETPFFRVSTEAELIINELNFSGSTESVPFNVLSPIAPSALPTSSPTVKSSESPTATPSTSPSAAPSVSPTAAPSASPSAAHSGSPTALASANPSSLGSEAPTMTVSEVPTAVPSTSPSASPSVSPSAAPSASPSVAQSGTPTVLASANPSSVGSEIPTITSSEVPTATPSTSPSASPSVSPSAAPSASPSVAHSGSPTVLASANPSAVGSEAPTITASEVPTATPSTSSASPSVANSGSPTVLASANPSAVGSEIPTITASGVPSATPSTSPSASPSVANSGSPTVLASANPSAVGSEAPTITASEVPTATPSTSPSASPSVANSGSPTDLASANPSSLGSEIPTITASGVPTATPSTSPSASPSVSPSTAPSASPSVAQSGTPTVLASANPSSLGSEAPTMTVSELPTAVPSTSPSASPSGSPTTAPSASSSVAPSGSPTVLASANPSSLGSEIPTITVSGVPTATPSTSPSASPSVSPSTAPSASPSVAQSGTPTVLASANPSSLGSEAPTRTASEVPTAVPSTSPSAAPSVSPSAAPSASPSVARSGTPTVLASAEPSSVGSEAPTITAALVPVATPTASAAASDCPDIMQEDYFYKSTVEVADVICSDSASLAGINDLIDSSFDLPYNIFDPFADRDMEASCHNTMTAGPCEEVAQSKTWKSGGSCGPTFSDPSCRDRRRLKDVDLRKYSKSQQSYLTVLLDEKNALKEEKKLRKKEVIAKIEARTKQYEDEVASIEKKYGNKGLLKKEIEHRHKLELGALNARKPTTTSSRSDSKSKPKSKSKRRSKRKSKGRGRKLMKSSKMDSKSVWRRQTKKKSKSESEDTPDSDPIKDQEYSYVQWLNDLETLIAKHTQEWIDYYNSEPTRLDAAEKEELFAAESSFTSDVLAIEVKGMDILNVIEQKERATEEQITATLVEFDADPLSLVPLPAENRFEAAEISLESKLSTELFAKFPSCFISEPTVDVTLTEVFTRQDSIADASTCATP